MRDSIIIDGKCARCRSRKHCALCVCCTPDVADDATLALLPRAGRTRVFAYVATSDPTDAHGAHYVRLRATSRIPSHGKVALRYRARTLAPSAVRTTLGNRRALDDAVARDTRLPLQSRCR